MQKWEVIKCVYAKCGEPIVKQSSVNADMSPKLVEFKQRTAE